MKPYLHQGLKVRFREFKHLHLVHINHIDNENKHIYHNLYPSFNSTYFKNLS